MNLQTPKYRLHKPTGQAVVTLSGKDFYLGKHDTDESRAEYDRLVSEWLTNGRRATIDRGADLTVNEMLVAYLQYAEGYYQQSAELPNIKFAIRQLMRLYGHTLAGKFGPLALKVVREAMIRDDLCRNEINKRIRRIARAFKWAVENELVAPAVFQSLKAVPGLRYGRSEARESAPVKPVPEAFIDAVQSHVLPPVWAMIQLQRLTGMRPGEVTTIRGSDLNMAGKVWTYEPAKHKTAHHGHRRTIFIGPKAQDVLRPWLKTDLQASLFNPREAIQALRESQQMPHRTPKARTYAMLLKRGRRTKASRTPREQYTVEAYGKAIARAVKLNNRALKKADPKADEMPHWHPHQLRHNAATWIRREFGLDVARVILGHRTPVVTEIYAEVDFNKAVDVMARVG